MKEIFQRQGNDRRRRSPMKSKGGIRKAIFGENEERIGPICDFDKKAKAGA